MGVTKTEGFTPTQNHLATYAKALGHPARIAILHLLAQKKGCMCAEIVNEIPLSQSTVSQHLKELKTAGLIKGNIDGPSVCYCIDDRTWNKAKKALGDLFAHYTPPSNF
jgi:DNA-binding transcriptional ArsR family regulator